MGVVTGNFTGTVISGGVTLGSGVTLHQTTSDVSLQGTLAIGNQTYNLDGRSITVNTGTPKITIGSGGQLQRNGSATNTVDPQVDSSGTIQDPPHKDFGTIRTIR